MELFYNPERMTETEVKETFVANQWLVDEILSILKQQPKGAGVQHVLIIAPRGMGKTTVLLMLRFAVLESELAQSWQPVLFPEESYAVYDLADFWLAGLGHLAADTQDEKLSAKIAELQRTHPDGDELEEAAVATIKDWRSKNEKQILMLVDSFDDILTQIGDERDNAKLRDVLMNDGTMMLVGGATTFFKEARDYDQPLYNLFKTYDLASLDSSQIHELLRRRARLDGIEDFDEQLRRNASRVRVLEYFTGGNPRLVMMLYRVITRSDVSELKRGIEKLLDEVTPYYKSKIESLPAQQRKILDHIARMSSRTREGLTPTEIAASTRLTPNQVSSQLKRLADIGYVRAANVRGRSSYYTLSEPLYAIWHQMRFGREARERMNWLVSFLKGWYDAEEINAESVKLEGRFQEYMTAGRLNEARDVLEHRHYLMRALENGSERSRTVESIIRSYLELKDFDTLRREVLFEVESEDLTHDTKARLVEAGLMNDEQVKDEIAAQCDAALDRALIALKDARLEEARENLDAAVALNPASGFFQGMLALIYVLMDKHEEAKAVLEKAKSLLEHDSVARLKIGALESALEKDFKATKAALNQLDTQNAFQGWAWVGMILKATSQLEESLEAFRRQTELDPASFAGWFAQGEVLDELNRFDEALESIDRAIQINAEMPEPHHLRGYILVRLDRIEEAIESFDRALALDANSYDSLVPKSRILAELGRYDEALETADKALTIAPNSFDAHYLRGLILGSLDRAEDSRSSIRHAFSLTSPTHAALRYTPHAISMKLELSLIDKNRSDAIEDWRQLKETAEKEGGQARWIELASTVLRDSAEWGGWDFLRDLVDESDLQESLFPLARALDYVTTGDKALIEKLSPEVRKIVEEVVEALESAAPKSNSRKSRTRKPKRK
ncbi:MAG TPA: tetratricopeptide repeat protein [Pyrinomonadaceae bacterium]|nr:tetratricopeptide repeat protein [Pyrinomonadaceae bacterium]